MGNSINLVLNLNTCMCAFMTSSSPDISFFMLFIYSAFLLRFLGYPYFTRPLFCFLEIWLSVCSCAFSFLLVELGGVFWNILFCLYCLTLSQYLLSFSFLPTFFFIFFSFFFFFHESLSNQC